MINSDGLSSVVFQNVSNVDNSREEEEEEEEEQQIPMIVRRWERNMEGNPNTTTHKMMIVASPESRSLIIVPSLPESAVHNFNGVTANKNLGISNHNRSAFNWESSVPNRTSGAPLMINENSCSVIQNSSLLNNSDGFNNRELYSSDNCSAPRNLERNSNNVPKSAKDPMKNRTMISKKQQKFYVRSICLLFILVIILAVTLITMLTDKKEESELCKSPQCITSGKKEKSELCKPPERIKSNKKEEYELCKSPECIISAANLLQSMNRSEDPCNDFYSYACGNWKEAHPRPDSSIEIDWITEATSTILRKLREHLQENTTRDEPLPVKLARTFYNSCMDMKMREHLGMEPIFKILEKVGLQRLPPLPRYSSIFYGLSVRQSNWIPTIVKIKKHLGIDVLLGLHVSSLRSSYGENNIWIGEPLTDTEQNIVLGTIRNKDNEKEDPILSDSSVLPENLTDSVISRLTREEILSMGDLKIKSMSKIISYFYNISLIDAKEVARKTFLFESQLMQIKATTSTVEKKTISDIEQQILFTTLSTVDLTKYVTLMLKNITNLKFDINKDLVYAEVAYIRALCRLLVQTNKQILDFYLWWKVVSALAPHTNWYMEANEDEYNTEWAEVEMPEARSIVCTKIVKEHMDKAVSYLMATPEFINKSENTLQEMFSNIKKGFVTSIETSWLMPSEKYELKEKAYGMKLYVGYPMWILNKQLLEKYYEDVKISPSSYLNNVANMMGFRVKKNLMKLTEGYIEDEFTGNPLDVNAFYHQHRNTITVIAGYLQFPFYDLGMRALEYGTLGFTLGHELNHGFDDTGILFDKTGQLKQNLFSSLLFHVTSGGKCFTEQYDNFEWEGEELNGKLTLSENLADNGGMKTALYAYRNYMETRAEEPKLPGLEEFTNEQLFFLAYANSHCSTLTKRGRQLSLLLSHPPNYFRVLGSLMNSKDFSNAWKCDGTSRMNPIKKCTLW